MHYRGAKVDPLPDNTFNYTALKPTVDDPCGTNFFAAWEQKLYVVVCGGLDHATSIKTVDAISLSIGLEVSVDEFFDAQYLVRNLASLFGIPAHRLKVPKIVAGSVQTEIEVLALAPSLPLTLALALTLTLALTLPRCSPSSRATATSAARTAAARTTRAPPCACATPGTSRPPTARLATASAASRAARRSGSGLGLELG